MTFLSILKIGFPPEFRLQFPSRNCFKRLPFWKILRKIQNSESFQNEIPEFVPENVQMMFWKLKNFRNKFWKLENCQYIFWKPENFGTSSENWKIVSKYSGNRKISEQVLKTGKFRNKCWKLENCQYIFWKLENCQYIFWKLEKFNSFSLFRNS